MEELKQMNQRRLIIMHKALHPRDDIDRGARGVMVIVIGNGHGDTSSSPEQD